MAASRQAEDEVDGDHAASRRHRYGSAIDGWVVVLSLPALYFLLVYPLQAYLAADPDTPLAYLLLTWSMVLLVFRLSWPLSYELSRRTLRVRMGLRRWAIPLSSILSVTASRSPEMAPALSLRRVRITFRRRDGHHDSLLLSPRDREAFLDDLRERCPWLREPGSTEAPMQATLPGRD